MLITSSYQHYHVQSGRCLMAMRGVEVKCEGKPHCSYGRFQRNLRATFDRLATIIPYPGSRCDIPYPFGHSHSLCITYPPGYSRSLCDTLRPVT